jgi:cleavage and polyadenylation specificity factor subunit 3
MFGEESVPKIFQGDRIYVSVDNKRANVDLSELKVS